MKDKNDNIEPVFFIKDVAYVTTKFATMLYNVTDRTVRGWTKKGLPTYTELEGFDKRKAFFKLLELQNWYNNNISQAKASATAKAKNRNQEDGDDDNSHGGDISKMNFVALEKEEKKLKVKLAETKLAEAEGRLVPADDLDKALYEQAIMHITKLSNDQKTLPVILANRSQDEVSQLLTAHNEEHLDTLRANIQRKFKGDPSNYDVFNAVLEARKLGLSCQELIDRIEEDEL